MTVKYEEAKRFALSLPGVTEEPHFGVPSFRVNKRILVTVPPGNMLHVFVSDAERDMCLTVYAACTEQVLWGGKVVGIRVFLAKATRGTVEDLILRAWKHRAPGKAVAAWETAAAGAGKKAVVAKVPKSKPAKRKAVSASSKAPAAGKAPAADKEPENVDAYIAGFPSELRARLEQVRATIRKAAPQATESISYRIPAYKLDGTLIFFAGFTRHIGMYPAPRSSAEFRDELAAYDGGKGTVQFPHARPLPLDLIKRIVKFRAAENRARAAARKQPKARKAAAKTPARKRARLAQK
jgi:uncharacterized protein YdhG (YjbR/CyaY superfamily)